MYFGTEMSGFNSKGSLNYGWPLMQNFTKIFNFSIVLNIFIAPDFDGKSTLCSPAPVLFLKEYLKTYRKGTLNVEIFAR